MTATKNEVTNEVARERTEANVRGAARKISRAQAAFGAVVADAMDAGDFTLEDAARVSGLSASQVRKAVAAAGDDD